MTNVQGFFLRAIYTFHAFQISGKLGFCVLGTGFSEILICILPKFHEFLKNLQEKHTVETSRLAPLTVDWPPLIAMYYLPYKSGKLKKIDLFSGTCSQLLRRLQ